MSRYREDYKGLLLIGDPHLESRTPGFRKDDYPHVVLEKLSWCLRYALEAQLVPVILGDLFHVPRDNANWLLGELMILFHRGVLGIYGNHDVRENQLGEDDSLDVLVKAGKYRLLDNDPWQGTINGRPVIVGGTSWGRPLPDHFNRGTLHDDAPLVVWVTHHDIRVPGYEEQGHIYPRQIPGLDLLVNGHIHRRLADYRTGSTCWITPGNIARRQRSDATRQHIPSVLRVDIDVHGWIACCVEVPHRSFDEVFYEAVLQDPALLGSATDATSTFVSGLADMLARKTDTAAGLMDFLEKNLGQFDEIVANEIRRLAMEVTRHGNSIYEPERPDD